MAYSSVLSILFSSLLFPPLVLSHPHPRTPVEVDFHANSRRSLADCELRSLERRDGVKRSMERRMNMAEKIRRERGISVDGAFISKRDLGSLNQSHHSDLTGFGEYANPAMLFSANTSCVLGPETTEGPYYVAGEYVRYDLTESQDGIPLYLDIELVDTNSCSAVSDVAVEIWAANSTGVYSGIQAQGNGDGSEENLNTTHLRGTQMTSGGGYVQFKTLVPGHYTGRTPHIHIAAHTSNGSWVANGTYQGLTVSHVGQLFFDQDLLQEIEKEEPYASNTQNITTNSEDQILLSEASVIDPFLEYILIGSSLSDGILGWASVGIYTSATYTIQNAATLTEDGGVTNPNAGGGGPPPGANGTSNGAPSTGSATVAAHL